MKIVHPHPLLIDRNRAQFTGGSSAIDRETVAFVACRPKFLLFPVYSPFLIPDHCPFVISSFRDVNSFYH